VPIAWLLKRYRQEKGLTQLEMADLLGTDERALRRWENGEGRPAADTEADIRRLVEAEDPAVSGLVGLVEAHPGCSLLASLKDYSLIAASEKAWKELREHGVANAAGDSLAVKNTLCVKAIVGALNLLWVRRIKYTAFAGGNTVACEISVMRQFANPLATATWSTDTRRPGDKVSFVASFR